MSTPTNWLTSMFSSEADSNDLIKSKALNTTKVVGLLAPLATGVAAVVETQLEGPLDGLNSGQKLTLWIAMFAFLALVVITDMLVRAITTSASLKSPVTLLPAGLTGHYVQGRDYVHCNIVASRPITGQQTANGGVFLVTYEEDGSPAAAWVEGVNVKVDEPRLPRRAA